MKKSFIILSTLLLCINAFAQSSVDAYDLTQTELRGTARFMAMGGAFTALGGDLSTLNQNPAGIGVYRGSDIGFTLDIDMTQAATPTYKWNNTHVDVNNAGYIGTFNIGTDIMQTFSWGISYSRQKSFYRQFRGTIGQLNNSLSNMIALNTDGVDPYKMFFNDNPKYNPYANSDINWMSILAFSGGIINPVTALDANNDLVMTNIYNGLWQPEIRDNQGNVVIQSTTGSADYSVQERGYVDEYNIDFGGNIANLVYWGLGIGISDITYQQNSHYIEDLDGANVPTKEGIGIEEGDCDYDLGNWKRVSGAGINVKFGLIVKPINEFRLGFAIHSPTWYNLNTQYQSTLNFGASSGFSTSQETDYADYNWNLKSPWRLMVGAAGVFSGRFILSADYEYQAYNTMKTSDAYGDFTEYNEYIASDFKASNTVRLGAEFRVTPRFSLRAGYGFVSSNVGSDVKNNDIYVVTSGCNPAYTVNLNTNYITLGAGFRYNGFYADAAYVYKNLKTDYHCYTSFRDFDGQWYSGAQAPVSHIDNQLVLTLGYKF